MAKALLTDGLLPAFPAADACPADLCMVGKLLTAPAFCARYLFRREKAWYTEGITRKMLRIAGDADD